MKKFEPKEYALYLLKSRDRSSGEIRAKMKQRGFSSDQINETLNFLLKKKFICDREFAKKYLHYQLSLRPYGRHRLRLKLKQLYLPADLIEEALSELRENQAEELIHEAVEKWLGSHRQMPPAERRQKLFRFLLSRGFDWEEIRRECAQEKEET